MFKDQHMRRDKDGELQQPFVKECLDAIRSKQQSITG